MDLPEPAVEKAVHAAASEDGKSYSREDGTLVINILVDPPCGESSESEIVVCAPGSSAHRLGRSEPAPEPDSQIEFQLGKNVKAGLRAESDPGTGADGVMIDLTFKF